MERHFNVTTYVFDPLAKKFLLIKHKKLGKWLSPGGHIDENERPDAAALREVFEETGLEVHLEGERLPRKTDIPRPFAIQLNVIDVDKHEHMDMIFLAVPLGNQQERFNEEESTGIQWFTLEEIEEETFETFDETRWWCRKFYGMR